MSLDEILSDFELLDEWEDRYRYVIELGRNLEPLPEEERTDANKVRGCVSQVWLATTVNANGSPAVPRLHFVGDSDAMIVRGLIAILISMFDGKSADEVLALDAPEILARMGLNDHLTPQRSNGLAAMVTRIRTDARDALESTPSVH